ncbi:MAG: DNA-directed RNA polymerase subunit omega [Oligosphaeraceae bacterium]
MNEEYLRQAVAKAKEMCAQRGEPFDLRLFITGVSKRAVQLSKGYRRLIPLAPNENPPYLDLALREVAAGKIIIERGDYRAIEQAERENLEISSVND